MPPARLRLQIRSGRTCSRSCGASRNSPAFLGFGIQIAIKPEILRGQTLRDVKDLAVVHAEVVDDVMDRRQAGDRVLLNRVGSPQFLFSKAREDFVRAKYCGTQALDEHGLRQVRAFVELLWPVAPVFEFIERAHDPLLNISAQ